MAKEKKMIPIYITCGDIGAILVQPYIYNLIGEWIGWIDEKRVVYSVHGHFVGTLTHEPRIVRKREWGYGHDRNIVPVTPEKIHPPAHFPLAPQLPELPIFMIDVLEEYPELMPSVDSGDLRDDMD